jgi:hypothetical protein
MHLCGTHHHVVRGAFVSGLLGLSTSVAAAQGSTSRPSVDPALITRLESLGGQAYQAQWRLPNYNLGPGRERIVVVISSRDCIGGRDLRFRPALRAALRLLAESARREKIAFSVTGVAIDWEADSGAAYLKGLADFDQWVVGRNWANDAAVQLVWGRSDAVPGVPQVVIMEREIAEIKPAPGRRGGGLSFSELRVVNRLLGPIQLSNWVIAHADSTAVAPR